MTKRTLTSVELFFDCEGITCREHYSDGHEESYGAEHCGWSEGAEDGLSIEDYFTGQDGSYIGPDQDGVYPRFDTSIPDERASRNTDEA